MTKMYTTIHVMHESGDVYGYQSVLDITEYPHKMVVYRQDHSDPPEEFIRYVEGDVVKIWVTYSVVME